MSDYKPNQRFGDGKSIDFPKYKSKLADLRKTTQRTLDNTENEGLGLVYPKANHRFADGKTVSFPNKKNIYGEKIYGR